MIIHFQQTFLTLYLLFVLLTTLVNDFYAAATTMQNLPFSWGLLTVTGSRHCFTIENREIYLPQQIAVLPECCFCNTSMVIISVHLCLVYIWCRCNSCWCLIYTKQYVAVLCLYILLIPVNSTTLSNIFERTSYLITFDKSRMCLKSYYNINKISL